MTSPREEFTKIYRDHFWGGTSKSGPGSDPEVLRRYGEVLGDVIKRRKVRSVVDIGCGDWAFSRTLDWTGIDYTGVDIVPDAVDALNHQFAAPNIRFVCRDLVSDELPDADLCVIKDVLQHLSNESVEAFLRKLKTQFSAALITNDITHKKQGNWRTRWRTEVIEANCDIASGGYRPLKLTDPPFNLNARQLVTIPFEFHRPVFGPPGIVYETKEVLLWERALDHAAAGSSFAPERSGG